MDHAHFERLGELVRALLPLAPELEVYSEAPQCLEAAPGSTFILVPRAEDADWLNINRPLFSKRSLRVVLFCTHEVSVALARGAVDFMDWLSLRVECPPGPVPFAVAGLRRALASRMPGIVWTGGDVETNFAAARPHHTLKWVSTTRPYEELVEEVRALRPREWLAWTEVNGLFRLRRVRWAMAEARRRTRAILVEPGVDSPGWWRMHGQMMALGLARERLRQAGVKHPGRLAALLDLEPEAIALSGELLKKGFQEALLEESLLTAADPGATVGTTVLPQDWAKENALVRGRAIAPVMRVVETERARMRSLRRAALTAILLPVPMSSADFLWWSSLATELPFKRQTEGDILRGEVVEVPLRHAPRTAEAWEQWALSALETGDPEVAIRWAHHALSIEPSRWRILYRIRLAQGRRSDAEHLLRSHLEDHASALDQAWLKEQLGVVLQAQGRYAEAESLFRQSLDLYKQALNAHPRSRPELLAVMDSLAVTLSSQGKFDGARAYQEEILATRLQMQGAEHPNTLASMNNLALTLVAQGRVEAARPLQEHVLKGSRHILGEEHPDTLLALNNLASTLGEQGQLDAAREQLSRLVELSRRTLGDEHPITLKIIGNLARMLSQQGCLDEARAHMEQVLEVTRRVLGAEHPDTLKVMSNLAETLSAQGRFEEARLQQQQVLEMNRRILGEFHPDTLMNMSQLATTVLAQGDLEQAIALETRALASFRQVLGIEHPRTLKNMETLAALLRRQGDTTRAEALEKEAAEIRSYQAKSPPPT